VNPVSVPESSTHNVCCPSVFGAPMAESDAEALAAILKALADPIRLCIVSLLAAADSGEACACDLPALVGRSQSTISYHLKILVEAGVVQREQRGKWAWFALRSETMEAIGSALALDTTR